MALLTAHASSLVHSSEVYGYSISVEKDEKTKIGNKLLFANTSGTYALVGVRTYTVCPYISSIYKHNTVL